MQGNIRRESKVLLGRRQKRADFVRPYYHAHTVGQIRAGNPPWRQKGWPVQPVFPVMASFAVSITRRPLGCSTPGLISICSSGEMKMKRLSLLIPVLAAVALFAQPVLAEDVRQDGAGAQAVQGVAAGQDGKTDSHESMMQESMEKMHAQMKAIHQTKDPKKRQKLLQEHSKSMRDSIKMMRETMGGMAAGCPMMKGGTGCPMMKDGAGCPMMKGGTGCPMMGGGAGCPMMGGGHMMGGQAGGNAAPAAQAETGQTASAGKTSASQEGKRWVCPMHPDVVRDQPGLCPICGMDLVEMDPSGAPQSGHNHMMGGCMMGGMKGGGMMGGGMKCHMMGMMDKHMDMMLMLMEQMIEHNEAAMAARK